MNSIIHSSAAAHHVSYFPSECYAKFRRELPRSLHCQPQNAPISVTPTMDILLGLLENSTANKVFVLSSMVASNVASSPFNLVLITIYIVNYGVFSK